MSEGQNIFPETSPHRRLLEFDLSPDDQKIIDLAMDYANRNKIPFDYMTGVIMLGLLKSNIPDGNINEQE